MLLTPLSSLIEAALDITDGVTPLTALSSRNDIGLGGGTSLEPPDWMLGRSSDHDNVFSAGKNFTK